MEQISIILGATFTGIALAEKLLQNGKQVIVIKPIQLDNKSNPKNVSLLLTKYPNDFRIIPSSDWFGTFCGIVQGSNTAFDVYYMLDLWVDYYDEVDSNLNIIESSILLSLFETQKETKNKLKLLITLPYDCVDPSTLYGVFKLNSYNLAKHFQKQGQPVKIAIHCDIFGKDQLSGFYYEVVSAITNKTEIKPVGTGKQVKQWLPVTDYVAQLESFMESSVSEISLGGVSLSDLNFSLAVCEALKSNFKFKTTGQPLNRAYKLEVVDKNCKISKNDIVKYIQS